MAVPDEKQLNEEYQRYIAGERTRWIEARGIRTDTLAPLLSQEARNKIENLSHAWSEHITPLAEAWWNQRGYGVVWPEEHTRPMQVYKLSNKDSQDEQQQCHELADTAVNGA